MLSAVWIAPIEKTFWSRCQGSAKVGFSYSKSTDVGELYFDLTNRYRTPKTIVDTDINWTETDQESQRKTRASAGGSYAYLLPQKVTLTVGAKLERNDELNLKLRFLGVVGAGYNLIATNESMLTAAAGLAVNEEVSYTAEGTTSSLEGVLHGAYSMMMQSPEGQVLETHSISAGLDYPGVGPEHAWLQDTGRAAYTAATDVDAVAAFSALARAEGILPALESAHAVAAALRLAQESAVPLDILVNLSGRGDKDLETVLRHLDVGGGIR